jgi:signal transduction histidine kinase
VRPSPPSLEASRLPDLLKETLDFMKQEISDRGVWVEMDGEEGLPYISVDPGQMKQAFFNLIKNAVQAMGQGGLLRITFGLTDRFLAVAFHDNGPGISPRDLSSIFEPYHTTKSGGSGLGLMIVQRIIRDHGGEIEVTSEPEKGTVFTVFLPLDEQRVRLLNAHRGAQEEEPV